MSYIHSTCLDAKVIATMDAPDGPMRHSSALSAPREILAEAWEILNHGCELWAMEDQGNFVANNADDEYLGLRMKTLSRTVEELRHWKL